MPNPPNQAYRINPITFLPEEMMFDPGVLPEGTPPTIRIVGSNDPVAPFSAVNNLVSGQGGFVFPPKSET